MKKDLRLTTKGPSDRAVQEALDVYEDCISNDLGNWYSMRMALHAACEEDARYRKKFESRKESDIEFGIMLFGISIVSFLIGVTIKCLAS